MAIPDAVKLEAFENLKNAHRVRSARLVKRLRILNGSLDAWNELWQKLKQMPFISFADAEPFDAETAKRSIENADVLMAEAAGLPREYIVVLDVVQAGDDDLLIAESVGDDPEAPAVAALVDAASGKASLVGIWPDRTWHRKADGGLRLRKTQAAARESGAN
jgi:hypothetical protein